MKPKALLITFLCIAVSLSTNAQQVDSATALTVAKNFAYENYAFRDNIAYSALDAHIQQIITSDGNIPLLYFINISPKGYIVVSGDRRDYPICSFDEDESWSDESMDLLPDGAKWFLDSYIEQIEILSKEKFDAAEEIQLLWDTYLDYNKLNPDKSRAEYIIPRFGDIHWNQTQYYNAQCPGGHSVPYYGGFDNKCPVGCVAVAIGQIMRYWHWPYSGNGSRTYTDPANSKDNPCSQADPSYGSLSTSFNKNYNWGSMPFVLTTYHNNTAELLKDAGYAVKMDYVYCSSLASIDDARNALVNNFRFSTDATIEIKGSGTSWDTWESIMKTEANNNRPFYYRGQQPSVGGHAFVGYGYLDIGTSYTVFRFNWGWGGLNNNTWYRVRDISSSYPLIPFSSNQKMIRNIHPNAYPCSSCPDYDFNITPTSVWKTHSSFHTANACRMYRVSITAGKTYIFKTGCGNGATADYDTRIYVYDKDCSQVAYNDDGCEEFRSKVTWKATYTGYAYVKVNGWSTQKGAYTMAYEMVDELIWTGNSSTNWNTAGNWNEDLVPDENINVIIPSNATRQPYIYTSDAKCDNLTINSGATLTVGGYNLTVYNNMNISGTLAMNNSSGIIYTYGDVLWKSGSIANFTVNSDFWVYGNWEFQAGSNANLTNGTVRFTWFPNIHSILCKSASSAFNNIVLHNFTFIYPYNCHLQILSSSNQNLKINGNIQIPAGATFKNYSTEELILKGNIINNGIFECHAGTVRLNGTNHSLMMNTGDYFNNLTFNQSGTVTINDTKTNILEAKKDVLIKSGVFNMQDRIMRVGGDWTNEKGSGAFIAGTGRVIFNGPEYQEIKSSENFNILEVDKGATGKLRIYNSTRSVTCNQYDWTSGGIEVLAGTFTALDLADNGIYGNYYVNSGGTINLHQDASQFIDLNGKLTFSNGGTINVYGGLDVSYWPWAGNAEINMNGGILDFKDRGINIFNSSTYSFAHNITGGTIRTSKGLLCNRTDFSPAGGTFEFYGSTDASISMVSGSHFYDVKINKSSKEGDGNYTGEPVYDKRSGEMISGGGKANIITLASNFVVTRNLTIEAGNFNLGSYTCNVGYLTTVFGKLIMNNAANDLTTKYMVWDDGSSANVTAGTFHAHSWSFSEGTTAKLGTGNTAYLYGMSVPTSNDAEFGNLVVVPLSKNITDDDNTKTYYPVRVMGNMLVKSGASWYFQVSGCPLIVVGNLTIENGGYLRFSGDDLEVGGALNLAGTLEVSNNHTATIQGAFIFPATGWLELNKGTFTNNYNSGTYNYLYGKLTMNNNSLLEFPGTSIMIGNTFINEVSGGTLRFGRTLNAQVPNNFKLDYGTVEFISANSNHFVSVYNGNYLNDVIINKTGVSFLVDKNLVIKNDLIINSGILNANDKTISIGGNWINNAGVNAFNEGTGRVIFNGSGEQFCSTEEFNILEVNKPSELLYNYPSSNITCQVYDWTSGGIEVAAGTFTALDLAKNGLYGSYSVKAGGTINLHQDAYGWIDLNGQLNFDGGGNINIYGGSIPSWWSYDGNAKINMNGGVLDFKNQGIYIYNSPTYSFTQSITGGTIRTSIGFECDRSNFTPSGGTFEFYGNIDAYLDMVSGSHLRNVIINKSSKEGDGSFMGVPVYDQRSGKLISDGTRANNISLYSDINIFGNLTINSGSLNTLPNQVSVSGNVAINNGGQLLMDAGGGLAMAASKSVTVNNGGLIEFNGESGTQSKITRKSSGYYALNIESGGKIGAEHTIFEYMNTNGVNIKPGAIVDIGKSFNNCIFRSGQSGGRLLTIDNSQTFSVNYAMFPYNSWGGNFNVYKSVDSGVVTFGGHSGDFSGSEFEWDWYKRIHWGGEVAGNVALQGVDVVSGQDICFDATNTLIVAGGESTFVVQDGGNVNLIAGNNIRMLEGTSVHSGAYLHAYISNEYCTLPPAMLAVEEDADAYTETVSEKSSEVLENRANDLFRVYPNPTTGIFTLELNTGNDSGSLKIEIFNMLGERILNTEQQTNSHYQLDLSGNKAGVYFIRVMCGENNKIEKLIKQ